MDEDFLLMFHSCDVLVLHVRACVCVCVDVSLCESNTYLSRFEFFASHLQYYQYKLL